MMLNLKWEKVGPLPQKWTGPPIGMICQGPGGGEEASYPSSPWTGFVDAAGNSINGGVQITATSDIPFSGNPPTLR